ncbi:MAG: MFS transporter [Smithellaceae bacterium]|nr:MFS transporter [Syntrophaceae bacterium]MDD4240622.1 MFS transporter [Smithellaceae bacterium]NLX52044.1 MFS transporter [Deltaproteobacteria bacterium]
MTGEKLWTGPFVMVSAINFLVFLTHFLLMVTIASYAVMQFGAATDTAGLVAGIFIIGALMGRLGTGRFIEDAGSKRVLIVSTGFFIVTSALYFAAFNLTGLIVIRFVHGIAFGAASTATGTIVAQIIPAGRRGEGIGYYSIGAILAVALGPFVGVLLISQADPRMIFLVTSALAASSFALSFGIGRSAFGPAEPETAQAGAGLRLSGFFEFKAIPISIIILVIGFSYSGLLTFISLYAKEIHLEQAAGFYFLVYAVTVLISRPFIGRLYDVRGANFVVYPCLIVFAAGMLLFSRAADSVTLLVSGALIALGYGNFISSAQAIAIRGVKPRRLGLATSTFFMFVDLGFGAGPYLQGLLIPYTNYRGLYGIMTGVILAAIPLYYILYGKKASAELRPARIDTEKN